MSLFVKICGITSSEAAEVAVAAGVDALGFVFAQSPRQISPSRAAEIGRDVPRNVEKVAVFLNPQPGEIESVLDGFDADTIQADWPSLTEIEAPEVLPVLRDAMPTKLAGRRVTRDMRVAFFVRSILIPAQRKLLRTAYSIPPTFTSKNAP